MNGLLTTSQSTEKGLNIHNQDVAIYWQGQARVYTQECHMSHKQQITIQYPIKLTNVQHPHYVNISTHNRILLLKQLTLQAINSNNVYSTYF